MPIRIVLGLSLLAPLILLAAEPGILRAERTPPLKLADIHGRVHDLEALRGRTLLVSFWASWCRPCVEEMPVLERLKARFTDRPFTIIAVNAGDTASAAAAFVARLGVSLDVLLDETGDVTRAWGVEVLPSAFLIDTGGRMRARYQGPYDWEGAETLEGIERLLKEDAGNAPVAAPK